ncbi:alpha/beta hydrolase family protein [Luteimonas terricola]|uniref:Peptidase S9 n=1 Tax=Luteimonas terricola TaxID=645597 RepID=A0ABQ2EG45_9GAMM|nr:S9 family peptidase [Luteimonas terricola]GGK11292.1 peptidase S9 [Luteimonas terricola]
MYTFSIRFAAALLLAVACATPAAALDIEPFIRKSEFGEITISPSGEYLAATVPMEDTTALVVLRRSDMEITGGGGLGKNRHVSDMWWANDERLLFSVAEKMGALDQPRQTGDIYMMKATERRIESLVGQNVNAMSAGTRLGGKKAEMVWAQVVDTLRDNPNEAIISVGGFGDDPYTRAERLNVVTGRRLPVTRAPVRNGRYVTDGAGVVRAAHGVTIENSVKTFIRQRDGAEWTLINDEASNGVSLIPIGFSADDASLYVYAQRNSGTSVIEAYDMVTGKRTVVLADEKAEPERVLRDPVSGVPVGVRYMDGIARTGFFDPESAIARQYRSLEAAFPGQSVLITSSTADGSIMLFHVWSDRNPGEFYTYDSVNKRAAHVLATRSWHDPEKMAAMRPIALQARDGLPLAGYVTLPHGSDGTGLPMVLMPHGGPYGIYDRWAFNPDVQLLAAAGYAVLQLNYRGSGNHGRAFQQAGAREWGGKMQDDLTDATRWAISEGIADPSRICIHGGSYGGYAALMGAAKEPDLYRCASGYVGVYDLPAMQAEDARSSRRLGNWSKDWVGDDPVALAAVSPSRMATRIKVPVFLAAGGEDEVAPVEHTRKMERALQAANVPVESLYYRNEGHGFYVDANRREYYSRLLDFLGRHIGGKTAVAAAD